MTSMQSCKFLVIAFLTSGVSSLHNSTTLVLRCSFSSLEVCGYTIANKKVELILPWKFWVTIKEFSIGNRLVLICCGFIFSEINFILLSASSLTTVSVSCDNFSSI